MPAFWLPLNGVTIGEVAVGSQPRLNGTLGLLNHRPRWYWWVGANVVVPPSDTEKVSESNTPRTVPVLAAWMSVWYHDTPNGAVGCWMTNRSKPVLCGIPEMVTFMESFSELVVMVTLPLALGRHALMAADEACRGNVNVELVAVALVATVTLIATATAPVVARAASLAGAEASRRRVGFMRSLLSAAAPGQRHRRSPVRAAAKAAAA